MNLLIEPQGKMKNKAKKISDPSADMNAATYCGFVEAMMEKDCFVNSILELWHYDKRKIAKLSKDDIVNRINAFKEKYALSAGLVIFKSKYFSPMFGNLKSYEALLGGVTRNASGFITAAKSLHSFWMTHVNFSSIDMDKSGNMAGTAEWVLETYCAVRRFTNVVFRVPRNVLNGKGSF